MIKGSSRMRSARGIAVVALRDRASIAARDCSEHGADRRASRGTAAPPAAPPRRSGAYKIGYSNGGGVGNGFREEQVCTAKAQAPASGRGLRL